MKLFTGRTESPGTMTFVHDGYWFKDVGDDDYRFIRYPQPQPRVHEIRRMWGIGWGGWFVGVIRATKAQD